jgi:hypothetical protein
LRFITNAQCDGIDFGKYKAYLESVEHAMPKHVYAFAADAAHYDLTSHSSLHDAWLESMTVREVATGARSEVRRLEITMQLLGPYHDRHIHLRYEGVTAYRNEMPSRHGEARYEHTAHGDVFTHEVAISDSGLLTHEWSFERGTLYIECSNIVHWESPRAIAPDPTC